MAPGSAADLATSEEECPMPWQDGHFLPHLLPHDPVAVRP